MLLSNLPLFSHTFRSAQKTYRCRCSPPPIITHSTVRSPSFRTQTTPRAIRWVCAAGTYVFITHTHTHTHAQSHVQEIFNGPFAHSLRLPNLHNLQLTTDDDRTGSGYWWMKVSTNECRDFRNTEPPSCNPFRTMLPCHGI